LILKRDKPNGTKKGWAALVGGYIFSHKFRLRPRLIKQFIPKKLVGFLCNTKEPLSGNVPRGLRRSGNKEVILTCHILIIIPHCDMSRCFKKPHGIGVAG
jgi:hypothetical protein